nr:MAG TPA: hypothetical protein [Caudoviricetes sp.]DAN42813.1 MAG TPA: hypothetical protein [Caudoviricetes sp.]DAT79069.1 MAG TPA: hypothetical protein [Caudoviricetes sp.]DAW91054.1 MAG TPA: hypothetical protein [Caudoviricetes sp.]DAX57766.1 MAG TPA: hypothetical protein [Caudoviricetes sp.]
MPVALLNAYAVMPCFFKSFSIFSYILLYHLDSDILKITNIS